MFVDKIIVFLGIFRLSNVLIYPVDAVHRKRMLMVFVPASAKRKCAFGLATCRLDSCATLVGFNFRLKQKE